MPLDIFNVVESRSQRVVDINNEDFPIGLSLIEKSHDTKDFDLFHLTNVANSFANLANVERVIVTQSTCFGVGYGGVFPSLRESSVVPDVS